MNIDGAEIRIEFSRQSFHPMHLSIGTVGGERSRIDIYVVRYCT